MSLSRSGRARFVVVTDRRLRVLRPAVSAEAPDASHFGVLT